MYIVIYMVCRVYPSSEACHVVERSEVTKPGALTLFGGIRSTSDGMHPYDSIYWRKKTTMKLVPYDNALKYPWLSGVEVPKMTLEQYLGLDRSYNENRSLLNQAKRHFMAWNH